MRHRLRSVLSLACLLLPACADEDSSEPSRPLAALALDGDAAIGIVRAARHSRSGTLLEDGSVVRIDLRTGARTELYRATDPCSLSVRNGFIHWVDVQRENRMEGPGQRAPATGQGTVTQFGSRLCCGGGPAVDAEGGVWSVAFEPNRAQVAKSLVRWDPASGTETVVTDFSSLLGPRELECGIATNTRSVAVGLGPRVVVVGRDGLGLTQFGPVDPAPGDTYLRQVLWVGLSETTVFWVVRGATRLRLFSAPLAGGTPQEHVELNLGYLGDTRPTVAGDSIVVCTALASNPDAFPVRVRHGQPSQLVANERCVHTAADATRIVWQTLDGRFGTAPVE